MVTREEAICHKAVKRFRLVSTYVYIYIYLSPIIYFLHTQYIYIRCRFWKTSFSTQSHHSLGCFFFWGGFCNLNDLARHV